MKALFVSVLIFLSAYCQEGLAQMQQFKLRQQADSLYRAGNFDAAAAVFRHLLDSAIDQPEPDIKLVSDLLYSLGSVNEDAGRLNDALRWYGLFQQLELRTDRDHVTDAYNLIGNVWFRKGDFTKAISFYFSALYNCFPKRDTFAIPSVLNNIGNVYFSVNDYRRALSYYNRSIALMRRLNMRDDLAASLINSGNVYLLMGHYQKAGSSFREAYDIAVSTKNSLRQSSALTSLGVYFERLNEMDSAEYYFHQSLNLMDTSQTTVEYIMTLRGLGAVDLKRKQFSDAFVYLKRAYEIADTSGFNDIALDVLTLLLEVSDSLAQPAQTVDYYRKFIALSEKISEADVAEKMARFEWSYRTRLRENTYEAQRKELAATQRSKKFITWFFIALFVFIAILLLVLWRLQRNRVRIEKHRNQSRLVEIRLQALSAQINPHFVSNALNSIQSGFISGDVEKASDYLSDFGMLIRMVLDNSVKNYISLSDEMQFLQRYLNLEQLRLNHRFSYEISCDDALKDQSVFLPPLLVQPYIENAVWHGLSHLDTHGFLSVHFSNENNLINVTILDNGIGLEKAKQLQTMYPQKRRSYAMEITKERIRLLGDFFKRDVEVKVVSPVNGHCGTRVTISVPLIHQTEN